MEIGRAIKRAIRKGDRHQLLAPPDTPFRTVCLKRDAERAKIEAALGKAKGTRGQIKRGAGRGIKGRTIIEPPLSDAPTLKQLGISRYGALAGG